MPSPAITRFIDPFTDFGFKKLFGTEPNKDLLISFLNAVFDGRKVIHELEYNKNEHHPDSESDGYAIFDLMCTGAMGEKFIIELQRAPQINFMKRAIYYTSLLATDLAPRGKRADWGYNLPEIYFVGLLEKQSFAGHETGYLRDIALIDRNSGKVFYDGLGYIFLELSNFVKAEEEVTTTLEKWLYVLKNMSRLEKLPVFTRKTIFEKLFNIAAYMNLNKEEQTMYNAALKHKWDNQAVLEYAIMQGKEEGLREGEKKGLLEGKLEGKLEGRLEGKLEGKLEGLLLAAAEMKKMGVPVANIAKSLKLSIDEVEKA
jgi:predicted transposase/invertase (TIGR01784 family)